MKSDWIKKFFKFFKKSTEILNSPPTCTTFISVHWFVYPFVKVYFLIDTFFPLFNWQFFKLVYFVKEYLIDNSEKRLCFLMWNVFRAQSYINRHNLATKLKLLITYNSEAVRDTDVQVYRSLIASLIATKLSWKYYTLAASVCHTCILCIYVCVYIYTYSTTINP